MEDLPPIDPRLIERAQQFALHRAPEPPALDRLAELLAPPATLVAPSEFELAAEARAKAAAAAKHIEQWRANLRKYAPIEKWEAAWNSSPEADPRNPEWVATQAVANWIRNGCKKHLVLMGAVGCGKSVAAATAVKHWVEPGEGFTAVAWLDPDQLVSAVLHDYADNAPKLKPYVVVDDMGTETKSDFAIALCKLLDRQGHKLVITTNLALAHKDPAKTFAGRYDERLRDRMRDTCAAVIVPGGSKRSQVGGF